MRSGYHHVCICSISKHTVDIGCFVKKEHVLEAASCMGFWVFGRDLKIARDTLESPNQSNDLGGASITSQEMIIVPFYRYTSNLLVDFHSILLAGGNVPTSATPPSSGGHCGGRSGISLKHGGRARHTVTISRIALMSQVNKNQLVLQWWYCLATLYCKEKFTTCRLRVYSVSKKSDHMESVVEEIQ